MDSVSIGCMDVSAWRRLIEWTRIGGGYLMCWSREDLLEGGDFECGVDRGDSSSSFNDHLVLMRI